MLLHTFNYLFSEPVDGSLKNDAKKLSNVKKSPDNRIPSTQKKRIVGPMQQFEQRPPALLQQPQFDQRKRPLLPTPVVTVPGIPNPVNDMGLFHMLQDINLVVTQMMNCCFPDIKFWSSSDIPDDFRIYVTCSLRAFNPSVFWGQLISQEAVSDF